MYNILENEGFKEIRNNIIEFCDINNKIPSILEYNQYIKIPNKAINNFLIINEISYSKLIELIGLKQISVGMSTEVYGIKSLLEFYKNKIEKYIDDNGKLPDFQKVKTFHSYIDDIRFRKLFGNSYTKFLKNIGIKNKKSLYEKKYSYSSYNKCVEDIINKTINSKGSADIIVKYKSGAVKISIGN